MPVLQRSLCGSGLEQSMDERDLASDAVYAVMDVAALDGPDRLDPRQSALRRLQGSEALPAP